MRSPFVRLAALVAVPVAATAFTAAAAAGGSTSLGDGAKKPSNSFSLVLGATAGNAPVVAPAGSVGLPSGKAVVANPYNVPLIRNAGSLGSGR